MPKVIVYVPAAAWRRLEARGLDPAATVREFAKRGYETSDGQLPERDHYASLPESGNKRPTSQGEGAAKSTVAQDPAARSGSCPMNPPRGTKCKVCGKVHPL